MGTHLHQLQLRYLRRNRSEAEDIRLHFDAAGARQLGGSSLYTVVALQTAAASCAPATGQLCLIEGVSVTLQGVLQRHRLLGYTPMVELDRDGLQLWFVEEAAAGGSTYRGLLFRRQ